jgi:hypothetical protein
VTRVLGEARLRGLNALGQGTLVFEGTTVLSNGNASANLGVGHATVRNTGLWRHAANSTSGSAFARRRVSGESGRGAFENLGRFEQTTDRLLSFQVPFRNGGFASCSRGPVVFDARVAGAIANAGGYLPQPGGELVLNDTDFQHHTAGTLDLAAGTLRGTGTIAAIDGTTRPKVVNRAVLRPGNPTGELTIRATEGFEQTATGELIVTLAPAGVGRLAVTLGPVRLGGALRVELAEGFSPAVGQSFDVLTFRSAPTGEFAKVTLPDLGPGKRLVVASTSTKLSLTVAP